MSFKELRSFTEIMRSIGYPKLISMEGFRTPNFNQVAAILSWLLERYDHTAEIPRQFSTEEDRIQFLKVAAQIMLAKARIKLNARKLYSADVYAVQELLKLAQLLYDATRQDEASVIARREEAPPMPNGWNPAQDVRNVKALTGDLATSGATIHGLVGGEAVAQDKRMRAMRDFDNDQLEKAVHIKIRAVAEDTQALTEQLENLTADEASLKGKIEKKKLELDRMKTRLKGLRGLRPAFMDEYERLEQELQQLYQSYMEKFRNLDYLESELDALSRRDDTKDKRRKRVLSVYSEAAKGAERQEMRAAVGSDGEEEEEDGDAQQDHDQYDQGEGDDAYDEDTEMQPAGAKKPINKRRLTPGPARPRGGKTTTFQEPIEDADEDGGGEDIPAEDDDEPELERGPPPKQALGKRGGKAPAMAAARKTNGDTSPGAESDDSISPVVSEDEGGAELQQDEGGKW